MECSRDGKSLARARRLVKDSNDFSGLFPKPSKKIHGLFFRFSVRESATWRPQYLSYEEDAFDGRFLDFFPALSTSNI